MIHNDSQAIIGSPFKTPKKERSAIFTEEGVSIALEHQLHDKNSDDEADIETNLPSATKNKIFLGTHNTHTHTTISNNNKEEINDDHGRHVNHRHHTHHIPPPITSSNSTHTYSHPPSTLPPSSTSSSTVLGKSVSNSQQDHAMTHNTDDHGHKNNSHNSHNSMNTLNGLWMLIDGIGLAIITAATILEGYELWIHFFHNYWASNTTSLTLWFLGRTFQIIGLLFLIGHASSFQIFHEIEQFGMLMLTIGPIVNMCACCSFHLASDPDFLFQKQWFSTETIELLGIVILDISMLDLPELSVLIAEWIGFVFLCGAAGITVEFQPVNHPRPTIAASYAAIVGNAMHASNSITGSINSNVNNIMSSGSAAAVVGSSDLHMTYQHRLLPLHDHNSAAATVATTTPLMRATSSHAAAAAAAVGDITEWLSQVDNNNMDSSNSMRNDMNNGSFLSWFWPHSVSCRLDTIHASECLGLILLMVVAYGQYRMKVHKHNSHHHNHNNNHTSKSNLLHV